MEKITVSIKVSLETREWLREEANRRGLNISTVGNIAILEYIEAKKAFESIGGIDTIAKLLKSLSEEAKK